MYLEWVKELDDIRYRLRLFADERGWSLIHNPKNLAMALAGEAGELAAEFQWLSPEGSLVAALNEDQFEKIRLEIADVFIYLVRIADQLNVDLVKAATDKIAINEHRFPKVNTSR
jgi:NTP pyrophosphatase (non-canonical NTP hydrolase)